MMFFKNTIAAVAAITMAVLSAQAMAAPIHLDNSMVTSSGSVFVLAASKKQCLRACTKIDNRCRAKVRKKGDANGWDGDLRRDEWESTCAPKVSRCQSKCGPIGPGECRIDAQGNEFCS